MTLHSTLQQILHSRRIRWMHAFFDFIAVFPLGHCDIKIALQIQPEVGGIAEIAPSLKAVLADIKRLPFKISVMRPEGTPTGMDAMSRRLDAIMAVQSVAMLGAARTWRHDRRCIHDVAEGDVGQERFGWGTYRDMVRCVCGYASTGCEGQCA